MVDTSCPCRWKDPQGNDLSGQGRSARPVIQGAASAQGLDGHALADISQHALTNESDIKDS